MNWVRVGGIDRDRLPNGAREPEGAVAAARDDRAGTGLEILKLTSCLVSVNVRKSGFVEVFCMSVSILVCFNPGTSRPVQ